MRWTLAPSLRGGIALRGQTEEQKCINHFALVMLMCYERHRTKTNTANLIGLFPHEESSWDYLKRRREWNNELQKLLELVISRRVVFVVLYLCYFRYFNELTSDPITSQLINGFLTDNLITSDLLTNWPKKEKHEHILFHMTLSYNVLLTNVTVYFTHILHRKELDCWRIQQPVLLTTNLGWTRVQVLIVLNKTWIRVHPKLVVSRTGCWIYSSQVVFFTYMHYMLHLLYQEISIQLADLFIIWAAKTPLPKTLPSMPQTCPLPETPSPVALEDP